MILSEHKNENFQSTENISINAHFLHSDLFTSFRYLIAIVWLENTNPVTREESKDCFLVTLISAFLVYLRSWGFESLRFELCNTLTWQIWQVWFFALFYLNIEFLIIFVVMVNISKTELISLRERSCKIFFLPEIFIYQVNSTLSIQLSFGQD